MMLLWILAAIAMLIGFVFTLGYIKENITEEYQLLYKISAVVPVMLFLIIALQFAVSFFFRYAQLNQAKIEEERNPVDKPTSNKAVENNANQSSGN